MTDFEKDLENFMELTKKAFSKDPDEAINGSIELARYVGVPEEKIIKSQEELDNLFTK